MSASLEIRDLHKQFPTGRPAIDGVSFNVEAGEIAVLLGPSGCGKTTTLRCVAGLEHPTGGSIAIGDRIVSSPASGVLVPPRHRDIGMVFQSYAVWPHMTVRQNVIYPLKHRRGQNRGESDRKVAETLELVGLSEYASRPVTALSGGQMQRVALARSLVYRPQLLLLDEPFNGLDGLACRGLLELMETAGRTSAVLLTSHNRELLTAAAPRALRMEKGRVLQGEAA